MKKMKWWIVPILLIVLIPLSYLGTTKKGKILLIRLFATESIVKTYPLPEKTTWKPKGPRKISSNKSICARQVTYARAMHTDLHGSDEIATVIAPAIAVDWTAEKNFFVPEGPVFDKEGNIYFCPVFPPEDVIMISLEPDKGKRRWVLEGFSAGAGTPLTLQDPETNEEFIYVGTYDRAVAVKTDGTVLWDVPTGLPKLDLKSLSGEKHCFGINYHIQSDSLVASLGDGYVYVLDRKTGKPLLKEPFMIPGGRTPVTNFSLPKKIAEKANGDIAHMIGNVGEDFDPLSTVLHVAAGELQKVTNFFSIDSNTGRIWIAATLPDGEDGKADGWSDFAALYGLDLVRDDDGYRIEIQVVSKVPGGTASTPAISRDGKRVYVADAFDTVYAIDAKTGERIWSVNVGIKVSGSIVVAADNGELYANTKTEIIKVFDRGDFGELGWTANLDMFEPGLFQRNFNTLGPEIGANGLGFIAVAGVVIGKQKFPFKQGAGLIDRETGEIKYFAEGGDDSVSSTVTGPDGGIYVGNSPLRRVLGRTIFGVSKSPQPVAGGITKFKPIHRDLIIRDALWASANRSRNAATFVDTHLAEAEADIFQIRQLLEQCYRTAPDALKEGSLSKGDWEQISEIIDRVIAIIVPAERSLIEVAGMLEQAVAVVEKKSL